MLPFALIFAVIWSTAIALAIEYTGPGRWVAERLTWLSVAVGVTGDLLIGLLLIDGAGRVVWWQMALLFAVSGVPVTVQSLARFYRYFKDMMDGAANATRD